MAVVGVSSKNDTTWPATQVGLRPVESCLGGHEEGVFRVDEGVEKTSLPLRKRRRVVMSKRAPFSDFGRVWNDVFTEKRNNKKVFTYNYVFFALSNIALILPAVKDEC